MEERTDTTMAVKVEKHSQYIILTYFHGDTNSMVDAHFNRALSNVCKDRVPVAKTKKICKPIKLERGSPCQGPALGMFPGSQLPPRHLLALSPADQTPDSWHPFTGRPGEGTVLPAIACPLSADGLSFNGQQYATSLLNLLHNDSSESGPSVASSSKPELHHSLMVQPGFREPTDPAVGFEHARCLDKNDLYWY